MWYYLPIIFPLSQYAYDSQRNCHTNGFYNHRHKSQFSFVSEATRPIMANQHHQLGIISLALKYLWDLSSQDLEHPRYLD